MITLSVPTRGRPERFTEMYRSAQATATGQIQVVAVVDDDDKTRKRYPKGPTYVEVEAAPASTDLWNHGTGDGDIVMLAADDILFRTHGWDRMVTDQIETWPDRIGMVYGNDLHPVGGWYPKVIPGWDPGEGQYKVMSREKRWWNAHGEFMWPTHPFVSREWIDAVGFFTPPYFSPTWEADTWILELAVAVERVVYLKHMVIEHLHPMNHNAAMDDTYAAGSWVNKGAQQAARVLMASAEMVAKRAEQVERLRAVMEPYEAPPITPPIQRGYGFVRVG